MPLESPLLDQNTALVSIQVIVNGKSLAETYQVVLLEVDTHINKLPTARIELLDFDPSTGQSFVNEEENFKAGMTVELQAGYDQQNEIIFKGIISSSKFDSKSTSHDRTIIECTDKCVALTLTKDNEYFKEKKDSAIVQEIIGTYDGISCTVTGTSTTHKKIVQYNASDWDFILSRAKVCERIVIAEKNKLQFVKPSGGSPEVGLTYGMDTIDINLSIDARSQRKKIEVKAWDSSNHDFKTGSSSEPSLDKQGSDDVNGLALAKELQFEDEVIYAPSQLDSQELKDIANSKLLHSRLSRIRGTILIQGFTKVKLNSYVNLTGGHKHYEGDMYVTGVKHTIEDGNFTTEMTIGLDPHSYDTETTTGSTPDNLGLLPGPRGLFIGEVTKIDADPSGDFRVQVKIPTFKEDDEGLWAKLSSPAASENSGFIWYPEIGDQVVVGFIMNDPRFPVVLGSLYSKKFSVYNDHQPDSTNRYKSMVTREHMEFIFDETDKVITLKTPGGQVFIMSDKDKEISLTDEHGNYIKMNRDGITINSIKDIKVDARQKIDMTAISDFKGQGLKMELSGDTSVKVDAGTTIDLTGSAKGTFDGGFMTIVKGTMVKIN